MPRKQQQLPTLAEVSALFDHDDTLVTTPEVAVYLRTTPGAMDTLAYRGGGPEYRKPGKRRLYRVGDVKAWVAEQSGTAVQDPAA